MFKKFETEKFDIIVQAGQSNSEGYGFGSITPSHIPNTKVWFLNNFIEENTNFNVISIGQEDIFEGATKANFAIPFCDEYIQNGLLSSDKNILVIRAAVGGTGFSDNRWGLNDDLFLRMMDMIKDALSLNSDNRLVAFLWHQGETDATNNMEYDTYRTNLTTLITTVRTEFKCENLPFLAGDFVQHWKSENISITEPIIRATKDICTQDAFANFVETDGLSSNMQESGNTEDTIHFSKVAQYQLGKRYFDSYLKIR